MKRYFKKGIKGFTLIELMIVIAIIAILAAILIPNFIRAREEAQYSACESNLKNIATALNMYSTDWNGSYPTVAMGADTGLTAFSFTPTYMQTIPSCPTDGSQYNITVSNTNGNAFTVYQSTPVHTTVPKLSTALTSGGCVDAPCYGSGSGLHN